MNSKLNFVFAGALLICALWGQPARGAAFAVAVGTGADFSGGAKDVFGTASEGEQVNTVYAETTGRHATMQLKFVLRTVPPGAMFVHLKARDDDAPARCAIALDLNGTTLFEGTNGFAQAKFETRRFAIPAGVLRAGDNTLRIRCLEKQGTLGQPPWFQVASCVVGPDKFVLPVDLHKSFHVQIPAEPKPFPEPLPAGDQPGFKIRGTKGWAWKPEQYLAEIPWIAKFKLNFLMNCYLSMYDIENHARWSDGDANRWWEDLPPAKKRAYEEVVRACQREGIEFCFGMNPNLCSKRMVNDGSPESVDQLYKHYAWMQSLGVKWFNISLDDISQGVNAASQAKVVNEIFHRLRAKDPQAQMIFCPTFYWGDGTGKEQQPYLETLARDLDKDIYLFWTGDAVVGRITRKAAETFRRIGGHRVILWDNYPVNDDRPTMHLGPVVERDPDLCAVIDGYMSNPHCKQNEANRIPLATCADYAYNPRAYDPSRSIGQAILAVGETPAQREVLRDLAETYPGMLIWPNQNNTGFNSVQAQVDQVLASSNARQVALGYLERLQKLSARMQQEFPNHYAAERAVLDNDIKLAMKKISAKYP